MTCIGYHDYAPINMNIYAIYMFVLSESSTNTDTAVQPYSFTTTQLCDLGNNIIIPIYTSLAYF